MEKKQKFMDEEGVNFKKIKIYTIDKTTVLKCKINVKKKGNLLIFLSNLNVFLRKLRITECQRGGTEQELESISLSSIMYIEEIDGIQVELPKSPDFIYHEVQIFMRNKMLNFGKVIYNKNNFNRLSDYLENAGAFIPLFMEDGKIIYINNTPWGPLDSIRHK